MIMRDLGREATDVGLYLEDPVAVQALEAWARDQIVSVEIPDEPWRRHGGSGALLARLRIVPITGSRGPSDVLMKLCSVGSAAREPMNHDEAWTRSPIFADRHLFRQVFASQVVEDGRVLMFLDSSETLSNRRTLGELPATLRPDGAAATTRLVLREWNSPATWQRGSMPADAFLRTELRGAMEQGRSAYRWAEHAGLLADGLDWIGTANRGHRRTPNPMRLPQVDSIVSRLPVKYLSGNSHGDLHMDNIIIPLAADGSLEHEQIRLVDLSGFDPSAPLSRDVATLLLSSILPTVRAGVSRAETCKLVRMLTATDLVAARTDEPVAAGVVRAVRAAAMAGLDADLQRMFHAQYLLSLVAQTIIYTSYSNVGPAGQQWYFALGTEAAMAFMNYAQCDLSGETD